MNRGQIEALVHLYKIAEVNTEPDSIDRAAANLLVKTVLLGINWTFAHIPKGQLFTIRDARASDAARELIWKKTSNSPIEDYYLTNAVGRCQTEHAVPIVESHWQQDLLVEPFLEDILKGNFYKGEDNG